MRLDAKPNDVIRAVAKAIRAKFKLGDWLELGLITDTTAAIEGHHRLLDSLRWGDSDYGGNVLEVVPEVLGDRGASLEFWRGGSFSVSERFSNLRDVEEFVELEEWLAQHDASLHRELYAGEDDAPMDDLQAAAEEFGIPDVAEHAARIRRGLRDDPAQAVGSSKELLETVLKAVLDLHGAGPETKLKIPQLVKQANEALGLDAAGVRGDDPGAEHRRRMLGSLSTIVNSAAEIRNAGLGTGHGASRGPALDVASARLVVSAVVAVATFYIEARKATERRGPLAKQLVDDIPF